MSDFDMKLTSEDLYTLREALDIAIERNHKRHLEMIKGMKISNRAYIEFIRLHQDAKHDIKLVAMLYARAKKGSLDEQMLYSVLLRRCKEEQ